jgi:hypothetical protein
MNFTNIVNSVLKVGETVASLVPYGNEALAAVDAVRGLLDDTKEVVAADPAAVAKLEEGRDAFEAAVNAHADATVSKLED